MIQSSKLHDIPLMSQFFSSNYLQALKSSFAFHGFCMNTTNLSWHPTKVESVTYRVGVDKIWHIDNQLLKLFM